MARKTENWLHTWLEYSSQWESPERFRLWSGIGTIAAALSRRVYVRVKNQHLFPNTYILLIGKPGSGKGNAMKFLRRWLKTMEPEVYIAPDGLTKRSFYGALENSATVPEGRLDDKYHSLVAFIEELGVFLRPGDVDFMAELCHVFDCPETHHYKTHSAGENFSENVCFNLMAAATPKSFRTVFSEEALEYGIAARTIIIYSDKGKEIGIFDEIENSQIMEKDLRYDLRRIAEMEGVFTFSPEAAEELVIWSKTGFAPIPKDPRFEHYIARRFVHLTKIAMICSAACRSNLLIMPEDITAAKTIMLEAESVMPKAVESLGANPLLDQQNALIRLIETNRDKLNRGTPEGELLRAMSREVNPMLTKEVVNYIANAKWVEVWGSVPERTFYPLGKGPKTIEKKKK